MIVNGEISGKAVVTRWVSGSWTMLAITTVAHRILVGVAGRRIPPHNGHADTNDAFGAVEEDGIRQSICGSSISPGGSVRASARVMICCSLSHVILITCAPTSELGVDDKPPAPEPSACRR